MSKHEKVPATKGQIGELVGVLVGEMDFSKEEAQAIIGNIGELRREVRAFYDGLKRNIADTPEHVDDLARWWGNFEKLFGAVPDLSNIVIPRKPEGLGPMRLIMVPKEIVGWTGNKPLQGTMNALKKHFKCYQYDDDLDEAIVENDRDPRNGSYALWVRDVREADEENANLSVNDLKVTGHLDMTVLEHMLLEADYFFEHGVHLDLQNVTLCAGSRGRDGGVPGGDWCVGRFGIDRYGASSRRRYSNLRSRTVHL